MGSLNLADTLVVKDGNLFLIAARDGRLPAGEPHPLGLWYRDCRFLSVHELRLGGLPPLLLQASDAAGRRAVHDLTSPSLPLSVRLERTLDGDARSLRERIELRSHHREAVRLELELRLAVDFEPMLAVRGLVPSAERPPVEIERSGRELRFAARGRDGVLRTTEVEVGAEPDALAAGPPPRPLAAEPHSPPLARGALPLPLAFEVALPPGGRYELELRYRVAESGPAAPARRRRSPARAERPQVRSDDQLFDRVLGRALADLELLRSELDGYAYYAAGLPWYATLFGRDSLITAMQTLAFEPALAADTIRLHGALLGRELSDERDEEPGKVLHELRVGEPAALGETPFARYYGSADATPLWLCLLCDEADWSGSLDLFRELRPQVEAALDWIDRYGDLDDDGLVEYRRRAPGGLANQGWKDSPDGVPDAAGRPLEPPVALVEIQGYAIRALRRTASLFELDGDVPGAARLRERAARTEAALERFWTADAGGYAIGLDRDKRPGTPLSSNQGHLLWALSLPDDRARAVRDLLMDERMLSGWGARTLAEGHAGFNPIGYHVGSVWPHDTAIVAHGLRRHGFDADFTTLFDGLLEAASRFDGYRLPELFGGHARTPGEGPVPYPVACAPQAWAAGAIPHLLSAGLGLRADGLSRRLRVIRPSLPSWVDRLELRGLRVAGARVDLRFERSAERVALTDASVDGDVEVVAS